jgi:hypothetical protein
VLSDVFWTGLFTFGGGVVGAVGTYFGVKSQASLQQQQLELDALRHESDKSHRKGEQESAAREQRQSLYLSYLGALDAVVHSTAVSDMSVDSLGERWAAFIKADDEIELGGTDDVQKAAYPMHKQVWEVATMYTRTLNDPKGRWPSDALKWLKSTQVERNQARADVVGAMRSDLHTH